METLHGVLNRALRRAHGASAGLDVPTFLIRVPPERRSTRFEPPGSGRICMRQIVWPGRGVRNVVDVVHNRRGEDGPNVSPGGLLRGEDL